MSYRMALISIGVLACASTRSDAGLLASDNFDSYTVSDDLNGKSGGSGFTAPWQATANQVTVVSTPSGFGSNNFIQIKPTSNISNNNSIMSRTFSSSAAPILVTLALQLSNFDTSDFIQFQLSNGAVGDNTNTLSFGIKGNNSSPRFFARVGTSFYTTYSSLVAGNGTPYTLSALFSKDGSANYNRVDLYVNGSLAATRVGGPTGMNLTSLSKFNVRVNSLETTDIVFVDSLSIAATPEPSTLAMGGVAALAGLASVLRRRRSA